MLLVWKTKMKLRCFYFVCSLATFSPPPPPQVLYTGKTPQCHSKISFPEGWDIWDSLNHWSNKETMLRYVDNVLTPYLTSSRAKLGLSPAQIALVINPRRACAARVTVVVLCVCLSVCLLLFSHHGLRGGL